MVDLRVATLDSIAKGLAATKTAVNEYAAACQGLRKMPEAAPVAQALDLSIERLRSIHKDLGKRTMRTDSPDAFFVALQVVEAGMSSLTDALEAMRSSYSDLLPHAPPLAGWFHESAEVEEDGAKVQDEGQQR
jgi:hypothetical protein